MSGRRYNRPSEVYRPSNHPGGRVTHSDRSLATLYNPFSIKNANPKWPDGLASYSVGRKRQYASEIYGKDILLVLFAGSVNWCIGWVQNDAVWDIAGETRQVQCQLNHCDEETFPYTESYINKVVQPSDEVEHVWKPVPDKSFTAWRGVSYGMKIRCCNTDAQNDGWYETVRINKNFFLSRVGVVGIRENTDDVSNVQTSVNTSLQMGPAGPSTPIVNATSNNPTFVTGSVLPSISTQVFWRGGDFVNRVFNGQPSYATGKLKDIADALFQLNPVKNHNEFIKVKPVNHSFLGTTEQGIQALSYDGDPKLDTTTITRNDVKLPYGRVQNPVVTDTAVAYLYVPNRDINETDDLPAGTPNTEAHQLPTEEFSESFVCDAFDCILVRIHGTRATRLLVHSVSNVELIASEFTSAARYQTTAYADTDRLLGYIDYRTTKCKLPFQVAPQYTN